MLEREKTHSMWKDLEEGNGSVFLLLTISGTTQSETITDLTSYKENKKDIEIIERRYVSTLTLGSVHNKLKFYPTVFLLHQRKLESCAK